MHIAAAAAGGTLTPGGIYFDVTTGIHYLASSASSYAPLSTSLHLGAVTLATALAEPSPVVGMTADISDILPSGEPIRIRYNGSEWHAQQRARYRRRVAGAVSTSQQYAAGWALPSGALALFSGIQISLKFELSNETDTITNWVTKIGTAGSTADTTLNTIVGTPLTAGDNQRGYVYGFERESDTVLRGNSVTASASTGWPSTSAQTTVTDGDITVPAMSSSALQLGIAYTQGVSNAAATVIVIYELLP